MKPETIKKHINKMLPELKKRLCLEDWDITYVLNGAGRDYAEVWRDYEQKTAEIRINITLNKNKSILYNTLLHEMLHLVTSVFMLCENNLELFDTCDELLNTHLRRIIG